MEDTDQVEDLPDIGINNNVKLTMCNNIICKRLA